MRKAAEGYYDDGGTWHLRSEWNETDAEGSLLPNPYNIITQMDNRGDTEFFSRWVWAVGKTFRSGYLNIPVNLYVGTSKDDIMYGVSVGFNIQRRRR